MDGSLTRVATVFVAQRCNVYMRFGRPARERVDDACLRVLMFVPGSVFCRIRWQANNYGTTLWQLSIPQAVVHGECMQRIVGIAPGAALLLHVDGARDVCTALISLIESKRRGMHPADVNASCWRVTHNRLAARAPLAPYKHDRHAAVLAQRALA
jgi:hypothetical protein